MKIIGHRGSRGTETENTLEALKAGAASGADRVEFDVWTTKDGVPVLLHDADFKRMAGHKQRVFDMSYGQVKKLRTLDGKKIITAEEAFKCLRETPIYMEIKDYYLSSSILALLDKFKAQDVWVGSNNHKVLAALKRKRPGIKIYAGTLWHPIETIHFIRKQDIHGMSLHYRWFNPVIYLFCRHYNIDLLLYTINNPWHLKFLKRVYPRVSIFTDYPDRAVKLLRG
jgi:glycerophosphoryl diester phosphodiesterase